MVATGAERPRFLGQSGHRRRTCRGLDRVHVHVDRPHQDLAGEDRVLRRRAARLLAEGKRRADEHAGRQRGRGGSEARAPAHSSPGRSCSRMLAVKTSPVASTVSFFSAPPLRSASRSGLNRTSTFSPALTASRRQPPARTRLPGLVISITQIAGPSSARSLTTPLTERLTCGLTQRSSTTSPLIIMVME